MLQERCGQDAHIAQVQTEIWTLGPHPESNIVCITQEQNNTLNDLEWYIGYSKMFNKATESLKVICDGCIS